MNKSSVQNLAGYITYAEWSSLVARLAHNQKAVDSNSTSAPNYEIKTFQSYRKNETKIRQEGMVCLW